MSLDIVSLLQIDEGFAQGRLIVMKEINGCDSSFITSCIIGHQIKKRQYGLIITLHNCMTHYHNVGLKMNYNLKKAVEHGLIEVYDLANELVNISINGQCNINLNVIASKIEDKIKMAIEKHSSVTVIIEGLSHLFDINFSLPSVNTFVRKIVNIVRDQKDSLLLLHCNIAAEEDVTSILANLMSHMSFTVIELENLTTGRSADVSGHLTIIGTGSKYEKENLSLISTKTSQYHFKLFDRGIKLFAPGSL